MTYRSRMLCLGCGEIRFVELACPPGYAVTTTGPAWILRTIEDGQIVDRELTCPSCGRLTPIEDRSEARSGRSRKRMADQGFTIRCQPMQIK